LTAYHAEVAMPNQAETLNPGALHESLIFRHRWWWDPVPDWFISRLDDRVLKEVAISQIQLQRTVLEAQLKAADQVLGILSKGQAPGGR
jgi:hypothetical protein